MKILQIIIGILLLLPGICSAGFMILLLPEMNSNDMETLGALWVAGFAVSAVGVWIIRKARSRT